LKRNNNYGLIVGGLILTNDRNYKCRIKQDLIYKGYSALVMENELFRLTILPGKGTDVIELLHKPSDTDFCWFTELGLRRKEAVFADFQTQYEGGWQEILPNLSGKHIHQGIEMEAYGEVSLVEWDYEVIKNHTEEIIVRFFYSLRTLPLTIEKVIKMTSGQAGFSLFESILNDSNENIEFDWGHHITFGTPFLVPGIEIELPAPYSSFTVPDRGSKGGFESRRVEEGRYRLIREDGIGVDLQWDKDVWPYVWFWRDFGGEVIPPYYGMHFNVGLEMFSSPPTASLTESIEKGTSIRLEASCAKKSELHFTVLTKVGDEVVDTASL
jgi:hypothetical protein